MCEGLQFVTSPSSDFLFYVIRFSQTVLIGTAKKPVFGACVFTNTLIHLLSSFTVNTYTVNLAETELHVRSREKSSIAK